MSDAHGAPAPARLPGVGHVLEVVDDDGRTVTLVRRKDGTLELHHTGGATVLPPAHARAVGALASGRFLVHPDLIERTDALLGGVEFDWVRVAPGAWAVGRSIGDMEVRRRTGATIVAILRGSLPLVAPDPDQRVEAGDELVVVSGTGGCRDLERLLARGT